MSLFMNESDIYTIPTSGLERPSRLASRLVVVDDEDDDALDT